jgi:hypothetical protein
MPSVIPLSNDHNQETGWGHLGSLAAKMQCFHCIGTNCWVCF